MTLNSWVLLSAVFFVSTPGWADEEAVEAQRQRNFLLLEEEAEEDELAYQDDLDDDFLDDLDLDLDLEEDFE